jgi:diguanylate cyclase (GGDEF)-like protein
MPANAMTEPARILWLDPDSAAVAAYSPALVSRGWAVDAAKGTSEAVALAQACVYHVAIVDVMLPDGMGTEAWARLRALQPDLAGIMTTSSRSLRTSIQAFSPGILTYLLKPLPMDAVCNLIAGAYEQRSLALNARRAAEQLAMLRALLEGLRHAAAPAHVIDIALAQLQATLQPDWVAAVLPRGGNSIAPHVISHSRSPDLDQWTPDQAEHVERLATEALRSQKLLIASESETFNAEDDKVQPYALGLGALLIAPLTARHQAYGTLVMANSLASERSFSASEIEALRSVAHATALALDNARQAQVPDWQAIGDQTSGVYSGAYLEHVLAIESARQTRDPHPYSLITVDWSGVRQAYELLGNGLVAGALRAWGGLASHLVRKSDVVARRTDDEFAVLLPNTDQAGAQRVAERIASHTQASLPSETAGTPQALKYKIVTYAPSQNRPR